MKQTCLSSGNFRGGVKLDQIEAINLVPKFLTFYHNAKHDDIDAEKRWQLWKEYYCGCSTRG